MSAPRVPAGWTREAADLVHFDWLSCRDGRCSVIPSSAETPYRIAERFSDATPESVPFLSEAAAEAALAALGDAGLVEFTGIHAWWTSPEARLRAWAAVGAPDLRITPTHREVMRRLDQGESLTEDQVDTLGALYLHELVEDSPTPALTPLGRRVLDVGGVLTTRQERPRLVSRPMPTGWMSATDGYIHAPTRAQVWGTRDGWCGGFNGQTLAVVRARLAAVAELIDWLDHEDAVRAQDGGS